MIFTYFFIALCMSFAYCNVSSADRKNIVLIVADDLDLVLDGMIPLKKTAELIGKKGANFINCYVASPICCPNRASILTGRYPHNHRTFNNSVEGGCSGLNWQKNHESETFASILKHEASYRTFYAGKYLNQYGFQRVGGVKHVPTGWDWWYGLVGNSRYYNYSLSVNGTEKKFGEGVKEYLTDVIKSLALSFLKEQSTKNPFLMVLAPPAPHAPFMPATRHNDEYKGKQAKRTPNFNLPAEKLQTKHWLVRMGPSPLPNKVVTLLDEVYRRRWETLLSVDEMVHDIYQQLESTKLLEETYIIFTSDNGYHIGQFSMPVDKRQPYETDIRVPLLIRGPGIEPSVETAGVSSVDIFATILEMGGLHRNSDGMSVLNRKEKLLTDRTLLIEYHGEKSTEPEHSGCASDLDPNVTLCLKEFACKCEDAFNNTYSCIRRVSYDRNNIYCEFDKENTGMKTNFKEAYDLNSDIYEINNIAHDTKMFNKKTRVRLEKLKKCKYSGCIQKGQTNVPFPSISGY